MWLQEYTNNGYRSYNKAITMKECFQFNENGVCVNPDIYFQSGGYPKAYEIVVKTALSPNGRWVFGFSYQHNTGGGGHGCWIDDDENFATENEAGIACLKKVREFFNREVEYNRRSPRSHDPDGKSVSSKIAACQTAIKIIDEELKPKHQQLELFT